MSDTKQDLLCPACKEQMFKVLTEQGVNVDICGNCGGIWFDNRELEKFNQSGINISEIEEFLKQKKFQSVNTNALRQCPVCYTNMVKHKVSPNLDLEIDECYSCGGKFLDFGELDKIRDSKDEENSLNQITDNLFSLDKTSKIHNNDSSIRNFFNKYYRLL